MEPGNGVTGSDTTLEEKESHDDSAVGLNEQFGSNESEQDGSHNAYTDSEEEDQRSLESSDTEESERRAKGDHAEDQLAGAPKEHGESDSDPNGNTEEYEQEVCVVLGKCRALVDFASTSEDELAFVVRLTLFLCPPFFSSESDLSLVLSQKGDIITILDKRDSNIGWWEGYVERTKQTGFFPFEGGWIEEIPLDEVDALAANSAFPAADVASDEEKNNERTSSREETSLKLHSEGEDEWASDDDQGGEQQAGPPAQEGQLASKV